MTASGVCRVITCWTGSFKAYLWPGKAFFRLDVFLIAPVLHNNGLGLGIIFFGCVVTGIRVIKSNNDSIHTENLLPGYGVYGVAEETDIADQDATILQGRNRAFTVKRLFTAERQAFVPCHIGNTPLPVQIWHNAPHCTPIL
ncbi:MAG: hypothetical protein GX087_06440 [Desulfobulbaceae bacterium]|nr:hypothetical protein [Desulfobulbaceae bacterium]